MKFRNRILALAAAFVGAGFAAGATPAMAEDAFADWGVVAPQILAEERGTANEVDDRALAKAMGNQTQHVTINGQVLAPGGTIDMGDDVFKGQVMSLNIINSGHNNVYQAQNVIAVTVVDSNINQ
ncbi:hypothetical protein [Pelagibius sp.]|uniref:hypothetical protein n=1 Tax=Pelagibius sp. TaxID=1931238 RepID=UPI003B513EBB